LHDPEIDPSPRRDRRSLAPFDRYPKRFDPACAERLNKPRLRLGPAVDRPKLGPDAVSRVEIDRPRGIGAKHPSDAQADRPKQPLNLSAGILCHWTYALSEVTVDQCGD
jgi:hypothetical protein